MRTRTHGRSLAFTCSRRTIIGAAPSQIELHISTVSGSAIGGEAAISWGRKDLPVLGQRIQRAVVEEIHATSSSLAGPIQRGRVAGGEDRLVTVWRVEVERRDPQASAQLDRSLGEISRVDEQLHV